MVSISELWKQVVESPGDIGLRLVLADALIEQGDSRGELIALQCRGADAKVLIDAELRAHRDNVAERVGELIAANWRNWLGDLAPALERQGSTFADGMLAQILVTDAGTNYAALAKHHELCAVRRVIPRKVRTNQYAEFLAHLAHDPEWVEVHAPSVIRGIRAVRKTWNVRTLRIGGVSWMPTDQTYALTAELQYLIPLAPDLETIELTPVWGRGEEVLQLAQQLPRMFPKLTKLKLENSRMGWLRDHEDKLAELPHVELD